MKFSEIVTEYVIKTDKEKIRDHSFDDYGLGAGWVFLGGWYDEQSVWRTAWGRVATKLAESLQSRMCDGPAVSLHFYSGVTGVVRCTATDKTGIPNAQVGEVDEMPADLVDAVVR